MLTAACMVSFPFCIFIFLNDTCQKSVFKYNLILLHIKFHFSLTRVRISSSDNVIDLPRCWFIVLERVCKIFDYGLIFKIYGGFKLSAVFR